MDDADPSLAEFLEKWAREMCRDGGGDPDELFRGEPVWRAYLALTRKAYLALRRAYPEILQPYVPSLAPVFHGQYTP